MSRLVCLGLGTCARALARRLEGSAWEITGTARTAEAVAALRSQGFDVQLFDGAEPGPDVWPLLSGTTHVLLSAPPDEAGDPVLRHHAADLEAAARLEWIGYLSTVGVYGGHDGRWVDETTVPKPGTERARSRLAAERAWLEFGARREVPVHVFRLAGIYGPGRNALRSLLDGTARRIVKPGQVFNRIHVDDIAAVLEASMARPHAGAIYNVADDAPAPPQDVVAYAAKLLGVEPPPEVPFERADLSPMARSFYGEARRVANARIKRELGVTLTYPTYREGLAALLASETGPVMTTGG